MKKLGLCFLLALLLIGCTAQPTIPFVPTPTAQEQLPKDEFGLWQGGVWLRGANIYQRRVYPEVDGGEFLGPGPFGPPYTQEDLNRLSEQGANYINLSIMGLFSVEPPYSVDEEAVATLDRWIAMATEADLFVVITFRSGPGRSEFAILGPADWLPENYLVETIWQDEAAQHAWAEMWQFTAQRYHASPVVIGYDLMCEPNSNASLNIWDPETFQATYAGTNYDWNQWYPDIVQAIRSVDAETPILIGGNGYSDPAWLPFLKPLDASHIIYTMHAYAPHPYTHQEIPNPLHTYPGFFDVDYDGKPDRFDHAWLEESFAEARNFQQQLNLTLAVNEFGLVRWAPNAPHYISDEIALFEQYGWNYALWQWYPAWLPQAEGDHGFNFRFGSNPLQRSEQTNPLWDTYQQAWARNTLRPSNWVKTAPNN